MDNSGPTREKYWEEKDADQKIEKLAEAVEILGRRVIQLEKENALLSQHSHADGEIHVPLVHNEPESPWYFKHLLGRTPK